MNNDIYKYTFYGLYSKKKIPTPREETIVKEEALLESVNECNRNLAKILDRLDKLLEGKSL